MKPPDKIAAWLQSRYGRKVCLKIGDIEAEARNIEEIKALLEQAEKVRPQMFQAEPPKT